jgi:hypothetical protein
LRSIPNGHVSPFSYKVFQVFTLASEQVSSPMCQHGMESKGHEKGSPFLVLHTFYKHKVSMMLQRV